MNGKLMLGSANASPPWDPPCARARKMSFSIAAYGTQTTYPVVELLLCDDAPQFNWLTAELALCWIHEYRHYKKLVPRFAYHCDLLQAFSQSFWKLYQHLLAYRDRPSPAQAQACRAAFDQLFGQGSRLPAIG